MKSFFAFACAAVVAAGAIGCDGGDEGSDYEIAEGTLSGKIGGQDWKFVSGGTDSFLSDSEGFFTVLYDAEGDVCGFGGPDTERTVLMNVPPKEGDYELGFKHNITMAVGSDNKVATTGIMTVEKITDTELTVGFYAIHEADPDFELSGHFTATICPPE